jgi:hypothetical protein
LTLTLPIWSAATLPSSDGNEMNKPLPGALGLHEVHALHLDLGVLKRVERVERVRDIGGR